MDTIIEILYVYRVIIIIIIAENSPPKDKNKSV